MSAPRDLPHVTVFAPLLDPRLSTTKIAHNQGAPLLALVRQLLRAGGVSEEQVAAGTTQGVARAIFSSSVQSQPEGQRINRRLFRLLSPSDSDTLEPDAKQALVAIAGSDELAAPVAEADQLLDHPVIRVVSGRAIVTLTHESDTNVTLSAKRGNGESTIITNFKAPVDMIDRVFFSERLPEQEWTPSLRVGLTNQYGTRLPAQLVESFATLLQDSVRLQALLHGALPPGVSRALYLHGGQARRNETGEPARRKTYVGFPVHKSILPESGCICSVLHPGCFPRESRAVTVKIQQSFCGQRRVRNHTVEEPRGYEVEGSRHCPNHRTAPKVTDGIFGEHCLCAHELRITCVHENKYETKSRPLSIPPTALGAFLAIAGASCLLCEDDPELDAAAAHAKVELALDEAETARVEIRGKATASTDREISDAFRADQKLFPPYSNIFARPLGRW